MSKFRLAERAGTSNRAALDLGVLRKRVRFLSDRVYCMTARPGTIKAEIAIPLERPRQPSMMMSSEFLALRRGLMSLIREESLKAMGGEVNDIALQGLDIDLHGQSLAEVI